MTILTKDDEGEDFNNKDFKNRQVIEKLLYLEKSTKPDIACAAHQCARFCLAPKVSHAIAVKRICRLLGDASHASEWNNKMQRMTLTLQGEGWEMQYAMLGVPSCGHQRCRQK
jgi:hypothetical protein